MSVNASQALEAQHALPHFAFKVVETVEYALLLTLATVPQAGSTQTVRPLCARELAPTEATALLLINAPAP